MSLCHIELKPGVRLHGLVPQMVLAIEMVRERWEEMGQSTLTITVGMEGQHTDAPYPSGHYRGDALDFRTKNIMFVPTRQTGLDSLAAIMRQRLGPDFFVKVENVGEDNEHLHVEWRPSTRY